MKGKNYSWAKIVEVAFVPFHLAVEFGEGLGGKNLLLWFSEEETS